MRKSKIAIKNTNPYFNSIINYNKTTLLKKNISIPYYQPYMSNKKSSFIINLKKAKTLVYQNMINSLIEKKIPCFNSFDKKFNVKHLNIDKFEEFCDQYQMATVKKAKTYILLFFHFKTTMDQNKSDYLKAWQYLNHDSKTINLAYSLMRQHLTSINVPLEIQIKMMNTIFSDIKFECKKSSTTDFIDILGQKVKITFNFKPTWLAEIKNITDGSNQYTVTPTVKEVNDEVFLELVVLFPQNMFGSIDKDLWISKKLKQNETNREDSILIKCGFFKSVGEWDEALTKESQNQNSNKINNKKEIDIVQIPNVPNLFEKCLSINKLIEVLKRIWEPKCSNPFMYCNQINEKLSDIKIKFKKEIKKKEPHYLDQDDCLRKFISLSKESHYYVTTRAYSKYYGINIGENVTAIPFVNITKDGEFDLQFKVKKEQ